MRTIYRLRFLGVGIFIMLFSFSTQAQVNTLAARKMNPPTNFPPRIPFEYTVGCNAIMPYLSDPVTGTDTYVSVSVIETRATNYISLERVNACLGESEQRYWDFSSSDSLRVNDVIKTSEQSNRFYGNTDNIVFCGRVGNKATLFIADRDFDVAVDVAGNRMLPVYFGELGYREFYSIAEIPGQGYVVCGETYNRRGILLYVDYLFQPIRAFESPAVLTKVIYDATTPKVVLLGVSDVTANSHGEIWIYSMRPNSNTILARHSYKTQYAWNNCVFPGNWEYCPLYKTNMILLSDKNSVALTLTSPERFPGVNGAYQSFLHIANIDGSNSEDYMFTLYDGNGQDKAFVSDIKTFDEQTYYILLHAYAPLGYTGTRQSSVILEATRGNTAAWKGLKIESNNPSPYEDLLLDKMFTREECKQLVVAGNENRLSSPQTETQLYYTEIETPLDLNTLHSFEYVVDMINVVAYTPIIGSPPRLSLVALLPKIPIPTHVDPNVPVLSPDQYFQGNCIPSCDNLVTEKVNIHANREMERPSNFPATQAFNYTVGCNAITPYIKEDKDTYASVSVVETGTRNYISIEKLYACLEESRQRYWNFSTSDSLRVNDVIHISVHDTKFYPSANNITFCGRIGNRASLFIADKDFNVAADVNGNPIYPVHFGDNYREFYSIAEIPGRGYVVCGETKDNTGVLLYVDYNFNPVATFECPAVFGKVIYNEAENKIVLMGIHNTSNYNYEICVYSVEPYSNNILASHSFNLQNNQNGSWQHVHSYGNFFSADLILLNDNNSIALTASNMEDFPGGAGWSFHTFHTFLHIAHLDGTPISDHIFNVCGSTGNLGGYKGLASAIQTFDEQTYYILLNNIHGDNFGIAAGGIDTMSGSVVVEADLNNNRWEGLKVEADFASANYHDNYLQFHKMFKREGCNKLVMAGDVNDANLSYSTPLPPSRKVHYAEIESPLNLNTLHPFEYEVGNVIHETYSPYIGTPPVINKVVTPAVTQIIPGVDNYSTLTPDYYYPGNCTPSCDNLVTEKVNIHANREMDRPGNFPATQAFNYTVGCNAITPYMRDYLGEEKDTYASVSVVETGTYNYISMERLYACLGESMQRYWNFPISDSPSLRVNDVIHVSEDGNRRYRGDEHITFCGRIGNRASLFIADKDFNVAVGANGNPIYPVHFGDNYREFYSIAEIPEQGYVVCGETGNNMGILLYVDYNLTIRETFECPAILGKVIYNEAENKIVLMGIHHNTGNYSNEICIYSVEANSNNILASHSFNVNNQGGWWQRPYYSYGNFFSADLILLNDNNSVALTASNTENFPGGAGGSYHTFLHLAQLDGTPISDHIFNVCGSTGDLGGYKGLASAIQTFDEQTYYILLNNQQWGGSGIAAGGIDTIPGSVVVEADLSNNRWEGLKVEPDFASANYWDNFLQFHKMFKREGCNKLVMAGDVNHFDIPSPSPLRKVHYAEIETPLNLSALHPFEYEVGNVIHETYSPYIGDTPDIAINNINLPAIPIIPTVDNNMPLRTPDYYYPGNCMYTCAAAVKSSGKNLIPEESNPNNDSAFFRMLQNKIQLEEADAYRYYQIYDVLGRLRKKGSVDSNIIEYGNLPEGIYVLQLFKKSGEIQTLKFRTQ